MLVVAWNKFTLQRPHILATPRMARHFSSGAVVSYFAGDDTEGLGEVIFPDSDDELGMEDEEDDDSEPAFEPLEVPEGYAAKIHGK